MLACSYYHAYMYFGDRWDFGPVKASYSFGGILGSGEEPEVGLKFIWWNRWFIEEPETVDKFVTYL